MAQWIARWTSNPTVAGSSPVKSVSLGSVAQNMFDRACVCGSHAVSLGSRRVHHANHYHESCQALYSTTHFLLHLSLGLWKISRIGKLRAVPAPPQQRKKRCTGYSELQLRFPAFPGVPCTGSIRFLIIKLPHRFTRAD